MRCTPAPAPAPRRALAATRGSSNAAVATVLAVATLLAACAGDRVDQLVAQLEDPHRREQAIEGLLAAVRSAPADRRAQLQTRVVFALGEAYRSDHGRGQIVAALAMLGDPRAEEVFIAAMRDADRGGAYLEAAMRAARMLGKLRLRGAVPHLAEMLQREQRRPSDRATGLRRALIEALEGLGDTRAVPALLAVLESPAGEDEELARLAARALGALRAGAAIPSLITQLRGTSRGLLVYEDSRRALCEIGKPALAPLTAAARQRDKRGRLSPGAPAAARVAGDLADGHPALTFEVRPRDAHEYRLAAAESLLRLTEDAAAIAWLASVLRHRAAPLHERQRAAELLGWYGGSAAQTPLRELLRRPEVTSLLRRSAALAYARIAGGAVEAVLAEALPEASDATAHHRAALRPRLEVVARCGAEASCYARLIGAALAAPTTRPAPAGNAQPGGRGSAPGAAPPGDPPRDRAGEQLPASAPAAPADSGWRTLERAILQLERLTRAAEPAARALRESTARKLAVLFARAHPQVKQAALVCLERWASALAQRTEVADVLQQGLQSPKRWRATEAIESQAFCLIQRLRRGAVQRTPEVLQQDAPAKEAR